jgi:hypothetical protein
MAPTSTTGDTDFVPLGPRQYLDRFAKENGLSTTEMRDKVMVRSHVRRNGEQESEYYVHASLLESHGDFACAGDREAMEFCNGIAEEMVMKFGITRQEAVRLINRQWSDPVQEGRPRTWIVGLDVVYHEAPEFWAESIHGMT